jgi:hypothetical protein
MSWALWVETARRVRAQLMQRVEREMGASAVNAERGCAVVADAGAVEKERLCGGDVWKAKILWVYKGMALAAERERLHIRPVA